MKKNLIIILIFFFTGIGFSQEVPSFEKKKYRDKDNKLYWNKDLPVYIYLSSSPDGSDMEKLESEVSADYAEPFYFDTEGVNYMRTRWAVDKNTKKAINPKQEVRWEIYADGVAPVTSHKFVNAKTQKPYATYVYGLDIAVELKSKDQTSKVQNIYYSLNGEPYKIYSGIIEIKKEGDIILKYFAVDNVGNVEKVKEIKFNVDFTSPQSFHKVKGPTIDRKNIFSDRTEIFLSSNDNSKQESVIYYQIDNLSKKRFYENKPIPLKNLENGEHVLKYYSVDKAGNIEQEHIYEFYVDNTPPITVSDILGDKFIVDDKIYFSGRTKLKITSIDNKSGVKDIFYSIDGFDFKKYNDPFYMPENPGWHIVRFYANDSLGNSTTNKKSNKYFEYEMHVDKIYVDLSGPIINHSYTGDTYKRNDKIYISNRTKIKLTGKDLESGLKYLAYSIDSKLEETKYSKPFELENLPTGTHKIEYFGYDNVNNRNEKSFYVFVDNTGPELNHIFSVKPLSQDTYPADVTLFITAQDNLTGVSKIFYTLNDGKKKTYTNFIKGFKEGENNIVFEAYDLLNNKSVYSLNFFVK